MTLENERRALSEERRKLERERREFNKWVESEQKRLDQQQKLFDTKLKILEEELVKLSAEKEKLRKQKDFYRRVRDFSERSNEPAPIAPSNKVIKGDMFFSGVVSKQAIKKRYKDLIKIYHPDNLDGDTDVIQEINSEYNRLCAQYKL
jgi:hypothetical protein